MLRLTADPLIHQRNVLAVCHIGLLNRPTYGFQVVRNTRNATHGLQSKNHNMQLMQDATNSILASIAFFMCMHCIYFSFFDLRRMTSVCCVRCIAYGNLETDLQPRFHWPTCGFQVVVCNTRNATVPRLVTQSKKNEIRNACTRETTYAIESILFFACIAIFDVSRVHALHLLCCVRQLGNRPLILFSAF